MLVHERMMLGTQGTNWVSIFECTLLHLTLVYPERCDVLLLVDDGHDDGANDVLKLAEVKVFPIGRLGQVVPERVSLFVGVHLYTVDGDVLHREMPGA